MEIYKLPQQTSQFLEVLLPAIVTIWNAAEYLVVQRVITVAKRDVGRLTMQIILEEPVSFHFVHTLNQHRKSQLPADEKYHIKGRGGRRAWSEWPLLQDCLLLQSLLACSLAHWVTVPMGLCLGSLLCLGYAVFCGNPAYLWLVSTQLPIWSGLHFPLCCDVTWNPSPGCSTGKSNSPHYQIQFTPTPNLLWPSPLGLAAPTTCSPRSHSLPLPLLPPPSSQPHQSHIPLPLFFKLVAMTWVKTLFSSSPDNCNGCLNGFIAPSFVLLQIHANKATASPQVP